MHVQYVYVQKYNRKLILERVLNWCLYLYCSLSPWPQNQKMCKKNKMKEKNQVDFFFFFKDYQYFIVETHPNPYNTAQSGKYILDKWIYKKIIKKKQRKQKRWLIAMNTNWKSSSERIWIQVYIELKLRIFTGLETVRIS